MVSSISDSTFGSQAPCNQHIVHAPFRVAPPLLLVTLVVLPWALPVLDVFLGMAVKWCRGVGDGSSAGTGSAGEANEARFCEREVALVDRVVRSWRNSV